MPKPNRPIILWRDKFLTLIGRPPRIGFAAVMSAAIVLAVAGVFLGLTASSLQQQPANEVNSGIPGTPQPSVSETAIEANSGEKPPAGVTAPAPTPPAEPASAQAAAKPADVMKQMRRWKAPGPSVLDYGWQEHPLYKDWRFHTGVDYQMAPESPVFSLTDGEVKSVKRDDALGLTIEVVSGEYTLLYAALSSVSVRAGTRVSAGAKLGLSGSSNSEPYSHLHLAIRKNGEFVNPESLLH